MKLPRSLAALCLGLAAVALTLTPLDAEAKKGSSRGKNRIKVDQYAGSGSDSTDLGVAEIEGRIFKPAVFFVLARSDFQYQAIKFRNSFVDRIVKSAIRRPF